jgi:mRNA interferase MazF
MFRGEIWWANLPDPLGSEPGYRRPVLIDSFNKSKINTVIVAVITSNLKLAEAPGNLFLSAKSSGLLKDSVVNVSQVLTIDKTFLTERISSLADYLQDEVDEGLRLVWYL